MKHTLLKNRELLARTVKSVHLYTSFGFAAGQACASRFEAHSSA